MLFPLLTPRLSIEPLSLRDLENFVAYRQNPEIARFQSWEPNFSLEQGLELIESQAGVLFPEPGQWLQLGISLRGTSELVGDVAIHNLDPNEPAVELGFTIAKDFQRKGFAKEVVSEVMSALFLKFSGLKLIAHSDSRNTASISLLQTLGFTERPEMSWDEEFKGESVSVLRFERLQLGA